MLDLARSGPVRSGPEIAAVVAFHGNLSTDNPALAHAIRARVLAMNGADDTSTSSQFDGFLTEMYGSPAPWQFLAIGHAVHCFTEKEAVASSGLCRYDAQADAWSMHMARQKFLLALTIRDECPASVQIARKSEPDPHHLSTVGNISPSSENGGYDARLSEHYGMLRATLGSYAA